MTEFEIGDDEYTEVNTSYDQDKEIGSTPSAYFAHSQPMNAKNGDNFMSIQRLDEDTKVESLNKNGTGVKRATRGVNPKNTKAQVLQFVYVSKSECDICKQYDGMAFATDSPNRPIIPRLESQGDEGSRPYTHPNCKCKWVRPFSDAGIKNFDDMDMFSGGSTSLGYSGEAEANEITQKQILIGRRNIVGFDDLSNRDKWYAIISMYKDRLGAPESFDPTSLPIASMLKMTYDAVQPTIALQLARMSHKDSNEVRDLIDEMVGESLSSERKHGIVLEHNIDFTFENLLKLTAIALGEALNDEEDIGMDVELEFTDDEEKAKDSVEDHLEKDSKHYSRLKSVFEEHDVWDEETNTLVDPSLLEDKKESDEGEHGFTDEEWKYMPLEIQKYLTTKVFNNEGLDEPYMPDVYGIDPYPHRHEFIESVCTICDYVLKSNEADPCWKGYKQVGMKDKDGRQVPNCVPESKSTEGGRGSGRKGHQKWMLGAEADPEECPNCMIYTEKKDGNYQICGNSY